MKILACGKLPREEPGWCKGSAKLPLPNHF